MSSASYPFEGGTGGGGSGTVTSVGLSAPPSILSVSGSPVTTAGTLGLSLVTQTANTVWAGPTTGAAANPTFRALVAADLPFAVGNLTDAGTDGIIVTGGTGAVIGSGTSLAQHVADTSHNGYLSSTDWNTFNNKQPTITTGNLTDAGTDGIIVTGGTGAVIGSGTSLAQHVADTSHNGYLSSTDWNTFNGKQPTITTGNLTDAGTDGIVVTGGTGAVIGSGTSLAQHVADSTHNGYLSSTDWSTFNGKQASGNYITALTGDVTASGPGSVAATLATVNSNVGSFTNANITVNAKGLVTAAASGAVGAINVVSKTTTYGASITDGLILCSSSAFTVTLPTAIGNSGAIMRVKKTDSSFANIITIATTSSQTIDGSLTVTLNTQYEEFSVCSDGANWQVLAHTFPEVQTSYTPTFQGCGTVASVQIYWVRSGTGVILSGNFTTGTVTAAEMQMTLPSGLTSAGTGIIPATRIAGVAVSNGTGTVSSAYALIQPSKTYINFGYRDVATSPLTLQNGNVWAGSTQVQTLTSVVVPIAGWN